MTVLHIDPRAGISRALAIGLLKAVVFFVPIGLAMLLASHLPIPAVNVPNPAITTDLQSWQRMCAGHHPAAKRAVIEKNGERQLVSFNQAWAIFRGEAPGTFLGMCP